MNTLLLGWKGFEIKDFLQQLFSSVPTVYGYLQFYMPINPLNPEVKIWILICCPYLFPTEVIGEKLIKYQENSSCVITSVILTTTLLNKALVLQGEFDADQS